MYLGTEDWGGRHEESVGKIKQETESQSCKSGPLSSRSRQSSSLNFWARVKVFGLSCVMMGGEVCLVTSQELKLLPW